MNIELDDEIVDSIVCEVLGRHVEICKLNIADLRAKGTLKDYELEDLGFNVKMLDALEMTHRYFGGEL